MRDRSIALLIAVLAGGPAAAQAPLPAPPTELADYVRKPDPSFAWTLKGKTETATGTVYDLHLVSQTWHGVKWEHGLQVVVPKGVTPKATMTLWNQGGSPSGATAALALAIAEKVKAPVAFLYGVPNQPIESVGGNKKEDALIAETFVRYLDTKDPTWPLLFPMAKSLVSAMNAIQAFAKQEWKFDVTAFLVTGASKRGWTSWLTAASGDPRVKAIAPMVIDTLNFPAQAKNQFLAFGKPSEMVRDYTERKLLPIPQTPEATKLWQMVDPWVYRDKLTLPKMLIFGTNDPYWPQDALNSYWDDLRGEKHILYVPNAGHDLREANEKGTKQLVPMRAVNALAAFARSQTFDQPMPNLTWKLSDGSRFPSIVFESDRPVKAAQAWVATADTRDFRKSYWTRTGVLTRNGMSGDAAYSPPDKGFRAFFVEADYEVDGLWYSLTTQIRIIEAKK